jgi:hypothetical protein
MQYGDAFELVIEELKTRLMVEAQDIILKMRQEDQDELILLNEGLDVCERKPVLCIY